LATQDIKKYRSDKGLSIFIPFSVEAPESIKKLCAFADYTASLDKNFEMASQQKTAPMSAK